MDSVHKNAKKELGQYPAILTSRLVNNAYVAKDNSILGDVYNKVFMYVLYDVTYPKITSKTCQTGDTDHDYYKLKIEHDIIDKPVKPVLNLLVRLN